ncbi:MAG: nicotinate (nicotinamide) nucleotide adenylyltransferase [Acidobacteria bacterium]|nr:nicotinate (nicotinamide) nucleotide adenylyltransferase [Acidobacteriota bacterium]
MKKIGVLGGTFDPPHKGHLKLAKAALKELDLNFILFVPCNKHKLREKGPFASAFHRSNMVALLCSNNGNFIVETWELEKGGISYTAETLSFLKKKYKNSQFFLLLGKDAYDSFNLWKDPETIRKQSTLVVFPRGNDKIILKNKKDIIVRMGKIDISSTEIRRELSEHIFDRKKIPSAVLNYIKKENLYLRKENG